MTILAVLLVPSFNKTIATELCNLQAPAIPLITSVLFHLDSQLVTKACEALAYFVEHDNNIIEEQEETHLVRIALLMKEPNLVSRLIECSM